MALNKVTESPAPITSLATHEGVLIASVSTGQLAYLNTKNRNLDLLLDTHGGPRGITVDAKSGDVFFTDSIRKAVVKLELPSVAGSALNVANNNNNQVTMMSQLWDVLRACSDNSSTIWQQSTQLRSFIDSFMDTPLKGPHGLVFDARGEIYVSDPGALGDTGLTNPTGSILRSIANCQQVIPLASSGLAFPCGIAANTRTGAIFVCELSSNRLLRFVSRTPAGQRSSSEASGGVGGDQNTASSSSSASATSSMIGSVFHQFSGSLGPMCVAVDSESNMIYVSRFDFAHCRSGAGNADGEIVVLHGDSGEEAGRIVVPGCEITALALEPKTKTLFIAERKNLYSINVGGQ